MSVSNRARPNQRALWINDYDTTRIGYIVTGVDDSRSGLSFPDRTTQLPGRVGTVPLAREFESNRRRVVVTGIQEAITAAQLITDVNELKRRASMGSVEIRFSDDEDKVYYGVAEEIRVAPERPAMPKRGRWARHMVTITFACWDPLIYDRETTVVGLSTAEAEVPLGTAISLPEVTIYGPSTGFTLTYRDFRRTSQQTLTLSGLTTSSTEYITIDCESFSITGSTGDNLLNSLSTAGGFLELDPQDAGGSTGPWPTLEISSTGYTGLVTYRKTYL